MYKQLTDYIDSLEKEFTNIPEVRKKQLRKISDYLQTKRTAGHTADLTFICTHNSRRSHLGQIWTAAAAHYYGIEGIHTFSGGTEATAFNPRAVAAIRRAGFRIEDPGGDNPHYRVFFDDHTPPLECFSKTYDDPHNPQDDFTAVMTCAEADRNCPFIPGASLRVTLPYRDPKEADGTPGEEQVYDKRCMQVATEMCYLMLQVKG